MEGLWWGGGGGRGGRIQSGYYCPLHENLSAKFMISIKVVLVMLGLHLQTFIPIKYHFKRFMASKTYRKTYGRNYTFFFQKVISLSPFTFPDSVRSSMEVISVLLR